MVYHKPKAAEIMRRVGDVLGVHNVREGVALLYYVLGALSLLLVFLGVHLATQK